MKTKMIKRFLSGIGETYTTSSSDWIPAIKFSEISLNSDGNQVLGKFQDYVRFDFTNELVEVKKYKPELISGIFRDFRMSLVDEHTISIKSFGGTFFFPAVRDLEPFRFPVKGDTIFFLSKSRASRENVTCKIEEIIKNGDELLIKVDAEIESLNGLVVGYADTDKLASSSVFPEDAALSIVYHPLSNNEVDIYLDFAQVSAIISR